LIADDRELGLQCFALQWSLVPGASPTTFSSTQFLGSGWYQLESNGKDVWRWIDHRAVAHLPPVDGDARLEIKLIVPERSDALRSTVTVEVAGKVLDRIQLPAGIFTKTYRVPTSLHHGEPTELILSASKVSRPTDPRSLAIQILQLGWMPAEEESTLPPRRTAIDSRQSGSGPSASSSLLANRPRRASSRRGDRSGRWRPSPEGP